MTHCNEELSTCFHDTVPAEIKKKIRLNVHRPQKQSVRIQLYNGLLLPGVQMEDGWDETIMEFVTQRQTSLF